MTALELLELEISQAGGQLERVLDGIEPAQPDFKPIASARSMREHVVHLCEVYQSIVTTVNGGEHKWGSYVPPSEDWQPLLSTFRSLRSDAVKAVLVDDTEKIKTGSGFIVGHDFYHVGQLATLRIAFDHNWDPYSIYAHD